MEEAQRRVKAWIERGNTKAWLSLPDLGLSELPELPDSLRGLVCYNNHLETLPALPPSLEWLDCSRNRLETLPGLLPSLRTLWCSDNRLQTLPALPSSLWVLDCYDNRLETLPALPGSLRWLLCWNNRLRTLPALPHSLDALDCYPNPLPFFGLEDWKKLSRLGQSDPFRAFQRHCRWRLIRRRARTKEFLNYAIYGRPGRGVGWFEACEACGIDPDAYDHAKYDLRPPVFVACAGRKKQRIKQ